MGGDENGKRQQQERCAEQGSNCAVGGKLVVHVGSPTNRRNWESTLYVTHRRAILRGTEEGTLARTVAKVDRQIPRAQKHICVLIHNSAAPSKNEF